MLASTFLSAVADRMIARSPRVGIKLPKVERPPVRPLPTEQIAAIAESIDPRYRAAVVLSAGTGLRQAECSGLTVDRVDFLRANYASIVSLSRASARIRSWHHPRPTRAIAIVPLPTVVIDALANHLRAFGEGPEGLIFSNEHGKPINRTRFSDLWRPAVKAAGAAGCAVPRSAPSLRLGAHPSGAQCEGRSGGPRTRRGDRNARHLRASLARRRRPHESRDRLGLEPSWVRSVSTRREGTLKSLVTYGGGESADRRGSVPRLLAEIRIGDHPSMRPTWD